MCPLATRNTRTAANAFKIVNVQLTLKGSELGLMEPTMRDWRLALVVCCLMKERRE
jgi:hypothetical protein